MPATNSAAAADATSALRVFTGVLLPLWIAGPAVGPAGRVVAAHYDARSGRVTTPRRGRGQAGARMGRNATGEEYGWRIGPHPTSGASARSRAAASSGSP